MISLRVNAQEAPVDIQEPVAIETKGAPALQQQPVQEEIVNTPVVVTPELPVINNTYDDIRLQIMSAQALSYEATGEYTQISKDATIVDGDSITFEAVKDELFTGKEEVHVYEAPCGRGWQLIVYDDSVYESYTDAEHKTAYRPTRRTYGYGCEHDTRTENW